MIGTLTILFFCQLIGEIVTRVTGVPVPGPVIGMVLLFVYLVWRGGISAELETAGGFLHRYLALLFVPAGVGVIANGELLAKSWAPIAGAVLIGTAVTIAVTGGVMQWLNRRSAAEAGEESP